MELKIKWTKRASSSFEKTVEFIEEEWGDREDKLILLKFFDNRQDPKKRPK